jgi:hypothetical protein
MEFEQGVLTGILIGRLEVLAMACDSVTDGQLVATLESRMAEAAERWGGDFAARLGGAVMADILSADHGGVRQLGDRLENLGLDLMGESRIAGKIEAAR